MIRLKIKEKLDVVYKCYEDLRKELEKLKKYHLGF